MGNVGCLTEDQLREMDDAWDSKTWSVSPTTLPGPLADNQGDTAGCSNSKGGGGTKHKRKRSGGTNSTKGSSKRTKPRRGRGGHGGHGGHGSSSNNQGGVYTELQMGLERQELQTQQLLEAMKQVQKEHLQSQSASQQELVALRAMMPKQRDERLEASCKQKEGLDEQGVNLALKLQKPLFNMLHQNMQGALRALSSSNSEWKYTSSASTGVDVASENAMNVDNAKREYESILQTYDRDSDLFGLNWIDFIQSDENEFREVMNAAKGMAHKRALKRLYHEARSSAQT